MSLTLCGLGNSQEMYYSEKITANRIHAATQYDYSSWKKSDGTVDACKMDDIAAELYSTIGDCKCIGLAVLSKQPHDVNKELIDHKIVRSELIILAGDAKKISSTIVKSFQITETHDAAIIYAYEPFSFREHCQELNKLAEQMMEQALSYDIEQELLCLLGGRDEASLFYSLPNEIRSVIVQKSIEVSTSEIAKQVKRIANQ